MILDLKEIAKLEKRYQNDSISLNALYNMVDLVSKADEKILIGSLALSTLSELGVLKTPAVKKEAEQLNS